MFYKSPIGLNELFTDLFPLFTEFNLIPILAILIFAQKYFGTYEQKQTFQ